jgi:hypothetical protein
MQPVCSRPRILARCIWQALCLIDIFTKRVIVLPFCHDRHWFYVALSNPGYMLSGQPLRQDLLDEASFPCMLVMDTALTGRRDNLCEAIRGWLNSVWTCATQGSRFASALRRTRAACPLRQDK